MIEKDNESTKGFFFFRIGSVMVIDDYMHGSKEYLLVGVYSIMNEKGQK